MVTRSIESSLSPTESQRHADECNKQFYGRFSYPWPPLSLPSISDREWGALFLNQELGDWSLQRIPQAPKVWVAGCGTNQAVLTALRFPDAEVLGSDISSGSLEISRQTATQLGIKNLTLQEQSLNESAFYNEFDYIICTGVIHHNADPRISLAKLSAALKPDGILEMMVYNYYHRILPTTYQKAMRQLRLKAGSKQLDFELSLTKQLIDHFPLQNSMGDFLAALRHEPEAMIADLLLQPIEHTYTVESFGHSLAHTGLEYWLPCLNQFDKTAGKLSWNIDFTNEEIAGYYNALSDVERWQIANLLLVEDSPMLWFYVQRKDSSYKRKSEAEVCNDFLSMRFQLYQTRLMNYVNDGGGYRLVPDAVPHPSPPQPPDQLLRQILAVLNPRKTFGEVLKDLHLTPTFNWLNLTRLQLTTTLFSYLRVAPPDEVATGQHFVHAEK